MNAQRPDEVLKELLRTLEEAGLQHALMGGYAVVSWGVPRATYDVDILVESASERLQRCFEIAERRGFQIDDSYKTGWRDRLCDMQLVKLRMSRAGRPVTSDLFLVATPFQHSAFARRRIVLVPGLGRGVPVITAADLILFKLLANRPKDRVDVQNVLTVQGVPDADYLRSWAQKLNVTKELEQALAEAEH